MSNEKLAIEAGLGQLGIDLNPDPLLAYLQLLHKWNNAYNLTAVRDIHSMIPRHILDSLAILPMIKGPRVLDVGTGAGLPGIPLALARPDLHVSLLDSNGKKTRFLQEVKRALGLANIEIIHSRVENYQPSQAYDTLVSRAFSELEQMINLTEHLLAEDGIWLAMKGKLPLTELETISYPYRIETYRVAGIEGERCCIIVGKLKGSNHGKNHSHC